MAQSVSHIGKGAVPASSTAASGLSEIALTQRQMREQEYYEQYSRLNTPSDVRFDPVLGEEQRPWNPYWFLCQSVSECFHSPEQRLLDFGCGSGIYSVIFGKVGYEVFGFDISPSNVAIAEQLSAKYGMSQTVHFKTGLGESLDYEDGFFDVVIGVDILHHVDINRSIKECLRVLKKGGTAFFKEPVSVPVFDTLRNTGFGRWLVPNAMSLDRHITEDERKLSKTDLQMIGAMCPTMAMKRFRLFSRLDAFNKTANGKASKLEKFDEQTFSRLPFTKVLGGDVVITLTKD
jgi:2-polyprenyl-3-methyl-5-hydroxy-6-metoxy-1,4-benzoquinol methylase